MFLVLQVNASVYPMRLTQRQEGVDEEEMRPQSFLATSGRRGPAKNQWFFVSQAGAGHGFRDASVHAGRQCIAADLWPWPDRKPSLHME